LHFDFMIRIASLISLFTLAYSGTCATRQLLLGDAERGGEVFRSHGCIACHSVNRKGGGIGPDLAQMAERGFSPYSMTALLWNHAPAMWRTLDQKGFARPELTPQQAADLFVFFFAISYFEGPGDARRGERVFRTYKCGQCHGINDPVAAGVAPVRNWQSLDHPILLAQQMWNHSRDMGTTLGRTGIPFPRLTPLDLTDMLVYLRSVLGRRGVGSFMPGSPEEGRKLFVAKGCAACHRGDQAFEGRPTRYTLNDIAAAMWNHPRSALPDEASISLEEMRQLVGYLLSVQFFEERGNAERGRLLFGKKHCVACHENPSGQAPGRAAMAGRMTSFEMAAALWKHGPAMSEAMLQKKIRWPRFDGVDMADLTSYLHGYEFKRRQSMSLR
jgi:cytochrome c2